MKIKKFLNAGTIDYTKPILINKPSIVQSRDSIKDYESSLPEELEITLTPTQQQIYDANHGMLTKLQVIELDTQQLKLKTYLNLGTSKEKNSYELYQSDIKRKQIETKELETKKIKLTQKAAKDFSGFLQMLNPSTYYNLYQLTNNDSKKYIDPDSWKGILFDVLADPTTYASLGITPLIKTGGKKTLKNIITKPQLLLPSAKPLDIIASNKLFIKSINQWGKRYGYEPIPLSISKLGTAATEQAVKNRLLEHNTFVRGVNTLSDDSDLGKFAKKLGETPEEWYNRLLNTSHNYTERTKYMTAFLGSQLEKNNIENTAENRAKWALTRYAPSLTGGGRAGAGRLPEDLGTIYASNSVDLGLSYSLYALPGSSEKSLSFVGKVRRPITFSPDRKDWIKDAEFFLRPSFDLRKRAGQDPWSFADSDKMKLFYLQLDADSELKNLFKKEFILTPYHNNKDFIDDSEFKLILKKEGFPSLNLNLHRGRMYNKKIVFDLKQLKFSPKTSWKLSPKYINSTIYSLIKKQSDLDLIDFFRQSYGHSKYESAKNFLKNHNIEITMPKPNLYPYDIMTTEKIHKTSRNIGNPYQHFIFIGPKDKKGLDLVEFIPPDSEITRSHGHSGRKFTQGLSRKSWKNGGKIN